VNTELVKKAAEQFIHSQDFSIASFGHGLIHHTYKITGRHDQESLLLQAINRSIFKNPEDILANYGVIYQYLLDHPGHSRIPAPLKTHHDKFLWKDELANCWRATEFIKHSYSPTTPSDEKSAYTVARCFARFTASLAGLNTDILKEIIPGFHDLSARYRQFEESLKKASLEKLLKATHVIAELRERKSLVNLFELIRAGTNYPFRVMHHDCKISNILFEEQSNQVICPVDLDTVMPGKFFSDPGDMIRTMACSVDEDSCQWEAIQIYPSFYQAILEGYLEGAGDIFTSDEKSRIHFSGLIMIFMQALRFLTDFLSQDAYYKTNYPEQNLNRSLNQLILLERLEDFLTSNYSLELHYLA
jgi:hypothetical protein